MGATGSERPGSAARLAARVKMMRARRPAAAGTAGYSIIDLTTCSGAPSTGHAHPPHPPPPRPRIRSASVSDRALPHQLWPADPLRAARQRRRARQRPSRHRPQPRVPRRARPRAGRLSRVQALVADYMRESERRDEPAILVNLDQPRRPVGGASALEMPSHARRRAGEHREDAAASCWTRLGVLDDGSRRCETARCGSTSITRRSRASIAPGRARVHQAREPSAYLLPWPAAARAGHDRGWARGLDGPPSRIVESILRVRLLSEMR